MITIEVMRPVSITLTSIRFQVSLDADYLDCLPSPLPGLDGNLWWTVEVDLQTGRLHGWADDVPCYVCVKVRDQGTYELMSEGKTVAAITTYYVPNGVIPGSYGDYIEFSVVGGHIEDWRKPTSSDFPEFFDA